MPTKPPDMFAHWGSFCILWGLPLAVVFTVSSWPIPTAVQVGVLAGGFAWMGVGCLTNALRCGRLHCYLSGPVLLLGAAAVLLVGYGLTPFGRVHVETVAWTTFAATALTFVAEAMFGRYVKPRQQ